MKGSWRDDQRRPPSSDPFTSLKPLARWLVGLLVIDVALYALGTFSDLSYLALIEQIRQGTVTTAEVTAADRRLATVAVVQLAAYLVTAIVFIVWFRRAYRNLGSLGASWLRFKPGWAVGSWFVPFLNLVRPKEIANDIWRVSDPQLPEELNGPALGEPVAGIVNMWWAALTVDAVMARALLGSDPAPTLDGLAAATRLGLAAELLGIVTSALAIMVVRAITERQNQRWQRVSLGSAPVLRNRGSCS